MSPFSRREFLERGAILSAAMAAGAGAAKADDEATKVAAKKGLANDKLRVAIVGLHSRGMSHVEGFAQVDRRGTPHNYNAIITHVCDCDEGVIGKAMTAVEKDAGKAPTYVKDFRKLLDNKDIDVITIATPNHWHATMAVWAMQAGKDVYCEKPATHHVAEGRIMVEAAKKYNKIIQVGTQSRSNPGMRQAIEAVHSGRIGKVDLAYGTCYKSRPSIGKVDKDQDPPKTMDYDLWCGPAAVLQPHRRTTNGTVHYDWHWIWEYGNGDIGNQGVHEMDKARWGLNKRELPKTVVSIGGRVGYVDDGETPNTMLSLFDYGDCHLIFEVRYLRNDKYKGVDVGNIFFGDKGYVVCPNYFSGSIFDPDGKRIDTFNKGDDSYHYANFLKAVRSRKTEDLNCPVEEGRQSASLCHLANISYRLGTEATMDKPADAFSDYKPAVEALDRMKAHLTNNKVDLTKAVGRVGLKLDIDAKVEKFTNGPAKANEMLSREYRKGFEITKALA
jgi:predicted dehydrogenase